MGTFLRQNNGGFTALAAAFLMLFYSWSLVLGQADTTGVVNRSANLRAGPATTYPVVGRATPGQEITIAATNAAGTWLQLADGVWIAAFLVDRAGAETVATGASSASTALRAANLRAGPGTTYAIVGTVRAGAALAIQGRNADGTWLQVGDGVWIAAFLVNQGNSSPPVATPNAPPAPSPTVDAPPPPTGGANFVVTQKRLLTPAENGGSTDGPSVHCGYGRALRVHVLDETGNRLNGIPVQAQYGAQETVVTGAQGKGDGVAEFVLGGGQEVKILRNADGSPATSQTATGLSTDPRNIPFAILTSSGYCQDERSCQSFAANVSCIGHFSWEVVFQRQP